MDELWEPLEPRDFEGPPLAAVAAHVAPAEPLEPNIEAEGEAQLPQGLAGRPQNSQQAIAHARAQRTKNAAARRIEKARIKVEEADQQVAAVAAAAPAAARALGIHARHVGRLRNPVVEDFDPLVRIVHTPRNHRVSLGISHDRLLHACVNCMSERQSNAVDTLAEAARSIPLVDDATGKQKFLHLGYGHVWDGVSLKYRKLSSGDRIRMSRTHVTHEVLTQRGQLITASRAIDGGSELPEFTPPLMNVEPYIIRPTLISGTAADAIEPGWRLGKPKQISFDDVPALQTLLEGFTSCTFHNLCDQGSGNLLMLKEYIDNYECNIAPVLPKCLVMVDTCGAHVHHRAKLCLRELRVHTLRHYGIAKLRKLQQVQNRVRAYVELVMPQKFRRVVGPAPHPEDLNCSLEIALWLLLDPGAPHHARGGGRTSLWIQDITALYTHLNGELHDDRWITHHCWSTELRGPCCASAKEALDKAVACVQNVINQRSDPVPAISTWTHGIQCMVMTLVRRLVYGLGLSSFTYTDHQNMEEQEFVMDNEAIDNVNPKLNGIRMTKSIAYFQDVGLMNELAILTVIGIQYDGDMLYPLMGDPIPDAAMECGKLSKILDWDESLVGKCCESWVTFMNDWIPPTQVCWPWGVLRALRVPTGAQRYRRYARGRILRIASAHARRSELKYAGFPYILWLLLLLVVPHDKKLAICACLLAADERTLDVWSKGIRRLYGTAALLLSQECLCVIYADLMSHAWSSDIVERLNSELLRSHPQRAPARNFRHVAAEDAARQLRALHQARGGGDPLHPKKASSVKKEEVEMNTLLAYAKREHAPGVPAEGLMEHEHGPSLAYGDAVVGAEGVVAPESVGGDHAVGAVEAPEAEGHAEVMQQPDLDHNFVIKREVPSFRCKRERGDGDDAAPQCHRGLSVFLRERNAYVQAWRAGQSEPMTDCEIEAAHAAFAERWNAVEDKEGFHEAFKAWQQTPTTKDIEEVKYKSMFAGGTSVSPLSARELHAWWRAHGWPKKEELADTGASANYVGPNLVTPFENYKAVNMFANTMWARNVPRWTVRDGRQFDFTETGVHNYMTSLGRDIADSGEILIMITGTPYPGAPAGPRNFLALISGMCYSPTVFDVCQCVFEDDALKDALPAPDSFYCVVDRRPCKVSPLFESMALETSDDWIHVLTQALAEMHLWHLTYTIPPEDVGLWRSHVTAIHDVGPLWFPEMATPLMQAVRARGKRVSASDCNGSDPLAPQPKRRVAPRGRGRGGGRGRPRGRGRGAAERSELGGLCDEEVEHEGDPGSDGAVASGDEPGGRPPEVFGDFGEGLVDLADREEPVIPENADEVAAMFMSDDDDDSETEGGPDAPNPDEGLAGDVASVVAIVGLDPDDFDAAGGGGPSGASGSSDPAPPWAALGPPTALGYVYSADGASQVLRIQRKPFEGRVWVNCYNRGHAQCRLNLPIGGGPTDGELYEWYFAEPALPRTAPAQARKDAAKRHMELARSRWSIRGSRR